METTLETIDHVLAMMPNVATSVSYLDLSVAQRFKLSAFEFCRYMRPVHCAESLDLLFKGVPFYEQSPVMMAEISKYQLLEPVTQLVANG
ncbi:hypothetical protein D3C71_1918930 [compost metagenome]